MRTMHVALALCLTVVAFGCTRKSGPPVAQQVPPAVAEARAHFTYKGKLIPPFFLADFSGGPEADSFWTEGMGSRISAVVVDGLFAGNGPYGGIQIRTDEFVSFDLPGDVPTPRGAGWFSYRFLGTTPSGITVLEYCGNTGGSGTIPGVLFVRFEMESIGVTKDRKEQRLVMRYVGEECWGDRVYRDVKLNGNTLWLGPTSTTIPANERFDEPERTVVLQ